LAWSIIKCGCMGLLYLSRIQVILAFSKKVNCVRQEK
jgi:hypothetical protein